MRSILTAGLKYFLWFLLLYGALTAVSLIPQVGAACNAIYRQPTEWLLKGLFPKAYLHLKSRPGDADAIVVEYASKEKIAQAQMEARTSGGQVQIPGKITDMKFYNMFLSFHLFFVALMLLSPITWKEKLTGIVIGSVLFYLFTVFRISLSLIVIGFSIFLLMLANPEIGLLPLGFEVFSAFSTVGLSLGITSLLSPVGKLILIGCMFIGRVGAFTLLISLFKQVPYAPYRYPKETVSVS